MEVQDMFYPKEDYIVTTSGNTVNRKSVLCGPQNIILMGKTIIQNDCTVRGDLASIKIGRCCVISSRAVIHPPFKDLPKGVAFIPMQIGDHVFIGEGSTISATQIGSYVLIGKNCTIGRNCVLKDCSVITDDTIVPPGTTVAAFAVMSGSPATIVDEAPECMQDLMINYTKDYYEHFKPAPAATLSTPSK